MRNSSNMLARRQKNNKRRLTNMTSKGLYSSKLRRTIWRQTITIQILNYDLTDDYLRNSETRIREHTVYNEFQWIHGYIVSLVGIAIMTI